MLLISLVCIHGTASATFRKRILGINLKIGCMCRRLFSTIGSMLTSISLILQVLWIIGTLGIRSASATFQKKDIGINFRVRFCVSPSHFNNWFNANEIMVRASGEFDNWDTNNWLGVRPFSKRVIGINLNVWWFIGVAV